MKKANVVMRGGKPALKVKVYAFPGAREISAAFPDATERDAERAAEFAFDMAQRRFWEDAPEYAREALGPNVKIWQDGRMGGWLVADGLADVESWDAVALARWARFAGMVRDTIADLCSVTHVIEDVDANEWWKPGSEAYNFVDTPAGTRCVADLKAEAIAAGFAPVVRV